LPPPRDVDGDRAIREAASGARRRLPFGRGSQPVVGESFIG
jgi:hypothetical protein